MVATAAAPGLSRRELFVRSAWAAVDTLVMIIATFVAAWVRYDLSITRLLVRPTAEFALLAAVVYLLVGLAVGPYRIGHLRGSFEETADLARGVIVTAVPLTIIILFTPWFEGVPRSIAVLGPLLALGGMFTARFVVRSYRWGRSPRKGDVRKVIVFGAGIAGRQLVRALQSDAEASYLPVALLDDDPGKRRLKIDGLRVRGGRDRIPALAETLGASAVVIAVRSASAELVRELREIARSVGIEVLVLPPPDQLVTTPGDRDLKQLDLEDLLGRRQVELDAAAISTAITGKTVLVTGAGGSIGSEIARQLSRFSPRKLILLDRDESALHAAQLSLTGRALLDDGTLALVSIRDLDALTRVFAQERPQVVFHAAALKHLTLLEQFPFEAWKTNVIGTWNVLRAAYTSGIETFVNISTDKAANPICVLGYSKRIAERLTSYYAERSGSGRFVSVRFGNVLGSRGSVIEAFTKQIKRGGPITVTDPEVERYFMLIPEASQLVLQAAAIGRDGDVLVLEMGRPVRIVDVARTLIDLSGNPDIEIVYTGLRHGEKQSEELFSEGEDVRSSSHPLVHQVRVRSLDPGELLTGGQLDDQTALGRMRVLARPTEMRRPKETVTQLPMRGAS